MARGKGSRAGSGWLLWLGIAVLIVVLDQFTKVLVLGSLGDDLKFVFITSRVTLQAGDALAVQVTVSEAAKCERCWHYRDDVGHDAAHPTLCGRCTSNLYGAGETRTVA